MKLPRLENWFVVDDGNAFRAPEARAYYMAGEVHGYPGRPDGDKVTTSRILRLSPKFALCKSRRYRLGAIDPKFLAFLRDKGRKRLLSVPIRRFDPSDRGDA